MPVKLTQGGKPIVSFLLPNGNLLIPQRMVHDRSLQEWVEVEAGTSLHKRWFTVREVFSAKFPDPRTNADYMNHIGSVKASPAYRAYHAPGAAKKRAAEQANLAGEAAARIEVEKKERAARRAAKGLPPE